MDPETSALSVGTSSSADMEAALPGPVAGTGLGAETQVAKPHGQGIWNLNYLLLWQGQLVSALGDAMYAIALGFWVLEKTGSTAMMGTLMAASTLPRVVISPFA